MTNGVFSATSQADSISSATSWTRKLTVEAVPGSQSELVVPLRRKGRVSLLFSIERREWKGDVHLQLKVRDMRI